MDRIHTRKILEFRKTLKSLISPLIVIASQIDANTSTGDLRRGSEKRARFSFVFCLFLFTSIVTTLVYHLMNVVLINPRTEHPDIFYAFIGVTIVSTVVIGLFFIPSYDLRRRSANISAGYKYKGHINKRWGQELKDWHPLKKCFFFNDMLKFESVLSTPQSGFKDDFSKDITKESIANRINISYGTDKEVHKLDDENPLKRLQTNSTNSTSRLADVSMFTGVIWLGALFCVCILGAAFILQDFTIYGLENMQKLTMEDIKYALIVIAALYFVRIIVIITYYKNKSYIICSLDNATYSAKIPFEVYEKCASEVLPTLGLPEEEDSYYNRYIAILAKGEKGDKTTTEDFENRPLYSI